MDLLPIGEAAALLDMNTSALRYYEDRGLLSPVRRAGRRRYSKYDLHRLAFIRIMHRLGLPEHPVRDCPHVVGALDRVLDGTSFETIAAEHVDHRAAD